jgi:hypothetical protein
MVKKKDKDGKEVEVETTEKIHRMRTRIYSRFASHFYTHQVDDVKAKEPPEGGSCGNALGV